MRGVGIDFGTTHSSLVFFDGRRVVRVLDNNRPFPSVVWYEGDRIRVGRQAKEQYRLLDGEPGHFFVRSVKRELGTGRTYSIFGRKVPAWEVASHIFQHLVREASKLGGVRECVLTVPVYFDGQKRAELRRAAEAAGLYVKAFIHEPFAALVGYAELEQRWDLLKDQTVLVFDWGGGTLDVTLIQIEGGCIYELGIGGLGDLAGDDFDHRLAGHARDRFLETRGLRSEEVSIRPDGWARLLLNAEQAKIELSERQETEVLQPNFGMRGKERLHLSVPVTRDEFERLIEADVQRALEQVHRVLRETGRTAADVELVLSIGGTSLIPLVDRELRRLFGSKVVTVPNAPTIIAEGAAVVAYHDWRPYLVDPVSVRLSDGSLYVVYASGTVLAPGATRRQVTFFCTDQRDGVARMVLVEGTDRSRKEPRVAEILTIPVNSNVTRAPQERVYAQFEFDADHVLNIRAHGSIMQEVVSARIYDLRIGLRTGRGEEMAS